MRKTTAPTILTIAALWILIPAVAHPQIRSSGDANDGEDLSPDATDPNARYHHSRMGRTPEDWSRHLHDPDVDKRLEAVGLLERSKDPKAAQYLMEATSDAEPRVATAAVDTLGKLGTKEASEVLAEKLFLTGTSGELRRHALVALGRIGDPASATRIVDFAEGDSDPELRGVAIRVVGDVGDGSVLDEATRASDRETDPRLKSLWQDTVAKISSRRR